MAYNRHGVTGEFFGERCDGQGHGTAGNLVKNWRIGGVLKL
jgi:hypothetical protein